MKTVIFYVNNLEKRYTNFSGELLAFCEALSKSYNVICCDFNHRQDEIIFPFAYSYNDARIIDSGITITSDNIVICRSIGSVEVQIPKVRKHLKVLSMLRCLVINDPDAMNFGMTKHYLLLLQGAGIPVIPTRLFPSSMDFEQFKISVGDLSNSIMKPVTGECGNSFSLVSEMNEESFAYKRDLIPTWIVQPLVKGITQGEYSYVVIDGEISHVFKKMPQDGQYRVNSMWSGGHSQGEIDPRCSGIITQILDVWPFPLLTLRVDFVYDNDTPLIMEVETVNPGFGFKVQEHTTSCLEKFTTMLKKYENQH